MPYEVSINRPEGYVRVTVDGVISFTDALAGRAESVEACRQSGLSRVMTDLRHGEWKLELEDALNFGMTVVEEPFPPDIRFAVLCRQGDLLPEVMIRALGLSGIPVKLTRTEQDALNELPAALSALLYA